jgi:hypothetical protein
MTIRTQNVVYKGKHYVIDIDDEKKGEPADNMIQIYRQRKDGTRGMQIDTRRNYAIFYFTAT